MFRLQFEAVSRFFIIAVYKYIIRNIKYLILINVRDDNGFYSMDMIYQYKNISLSLTISTSNI